MGPRGFWIYLPVLDRKVSPMGAFFVGLLFGFIGLPIYFRSWHDFWFLLSWVAPLFVLALPTGSAPFVLVLCCLQGLYGYARAANSNQRR